MLFSSIKEINMLISNGMSDIYHWGKKLRHGLIKATLISSCHWKILVPFYLRKKRPENAFLTLTRNSELWPNRTEKQIMPFKTAIN